MGENQIYMVRNDDLRISFTPYIDLNGSVRSLFPLEPENQTDNNQLQLYRNHETHILSIHPIRRVQRNRCPPSIVDRLGDSWQACAHTQPSMPSSLHQRISFVLRPCHQKVYMCTRQQ